MNAIRSYRDLTAWQRAYQLVLETYRVTQAFPVDERFALTQQARRAATGVVCNIAEGWGRDTRADYRRFVAMARGSIYELQTQMWVVADLGYVSTEHRIQGMIEETDRLVNGLLRSL